MSKSSSTAVKRQESPKDPPIIVLDRAAMRVIPYGGGREEGGNIVQFEKHRIHPGFNKPASGAVWDVVSNHDAYKGWLGKSEIVELDEVRDIADLAVDPILQNSSSKSSIEWWLDRETRSAVIDKLKTKLEGFGKRRQHAHDGDADS